jgi:hypothetical protein
VDYTAEIVEEGFFAILSYMLIDAISNLSYHCLVGSQGQIEYDH